MFKGHKVYQKVALIAKVTGQDGSYLAELLLEKDHEVNGNYMAKTCDCLRLSQMILGK